MKVCGKPPLNSLIFTSLFLLGLPLGLARSFLVSAVVAQRHGWLAAFLVAGAPGRARWAPAG